MAKTYLPNGAGAPFKNIIRFIGGKPLDGRTVVDTYSDISGDNYKALFTNDDNGTQIVSYYTGMLVVTKDTGKLYVLAADGLFKEVTPDLSNIYGSITATNYSEAKSLANVNNMGQIIYVTSEETSTTEKDEKGKFIVYSSGPYIVTGAGTVAKLGTTTATGDLAGDVETLKGNVSQINTNLYTNLPLYVTISERFVDFFDSSSHVKFISADEFTGRNSLNLLYTDFYSSIKQIRLILVDRDGCSVGFTSSSRSTGAESVLCGIYEFTVGQIHKVVKISVKTDGLYIHTEDFDAHYLLATKNELSKLSSDLTDTISKLPLFSTEVYNSTEEAPFPAEPNDHTLYLIPEEGSEGDVYREWIYVNNTWEKLGVHSIDVESISTALNEKVDKVTGKELIDSTLIPTITDNESRLDVLQPIVGTTAISEGNYIAANSTLVEAVTTLDSQVKSIVDSALVEVSTSNNKYISTSEENHVVTLTPVICAVQNATSESTGLADAYDVQQYIQKSLEWVDVVA